MSNADRIQALPVTTPESRDVLSDLIFVLRFDGQRLLSLSLADQLRERVGLGVRKYGKPLQTNNGRDVLLDIRQELLDGIMYSHQAIMQGERVAHIRNVLIDMVESLDQIERAK